MLVRVLTVLVRGCGMVLGRVVLADVVMVRRLVMVVGGGVVVGGGLVVMFGCGMLRCVCHLSFLRESEKICSR